MSALRLFHRDNGGGIVLAAWHSSHSITWRWFLSVRGIISRTGEPRFKFLWHRSRHNCGSSTIVRLPFLRFDWQTQHPMWFRDVWRREQRERMSREDVA
jgi:hypothetical protein